MITHHWVNTQQLTPGLERYYPFFRLLVCFGGIDILRNKFDTTSGIYLVGEEEVINDISDNIEKMMKKVENAVIRKKFKDKDIHLSLQRAQCRDKVVKAICYITQEELKSWRLRLSQRDFYSIKKDIELRKEYIMQTPSLKILKTFKCREN